MKGVIPNESPPSWPMAELKAQAVASRSFALTAGVGGNGFDLYADTRSQVYKGLESEYSTQQRRRRIDPRPGGRVRRQDRRDALLRLLRRPHREHPERLRRPGDPLPQGVPDPYDGECPLHTWTLRFSGPEISDKLGAYLDGRLKQVVVTKRGVSPRIIAAKLIGTGGVTTVSGEQLEVALGGYDTWMTFQKLVSAAG